MGKRNVKRKPMKKLKAKLETQFNCLFCNHENSIECKIDHSNKVGHLSCKICDVTWQTSITYLDEPVDVYSAWIDACELVNKSKRAAKQKERERVRQATEENDVRPPPSQDYSADRLSPYDDDDDDGEY